MTPPQPNRKRPRLVSLSEHDEGARSRISDFEQGHTLCFWVRKSIATQIWARLYVDPVRPSAGRRSDASENGIHRISGPEPSFTNRRRCCKTKRMVCARLAAPGPCQRCEKPFGIQSSGNGRTLDLVLALSRFRFFWPDPLVFVASSSSSSSSCSPSSSSSPASSPPFSSSQGLVQAAGFLFGFFSSSESVFENKAAKASSSSQGLVQASGFLVGVFSFSFSTFFSSPSASFSSSSS